MLKFFLVILLVLSTVAVVVHEVLVYQLTSTELAMAEEGSSDSKAGNKEGKDLTKEWLGCRLELSGAVGASNLSHFGGHPSRSCCKGFYNKPYNPPEVI